MFLFSRSPYDSLHGIADGVTASWCLFELVRAKVGRGVQRWVRLPIGIITLVKTKFAGRSRASATPRPFLCCGGACSPDLDPIEPA